MYIFGKEAAAAELKAFGTHRKLQFPSIQGFYSKENGDRDSKEAVQRIGEIWERRDEWKREIHAHYDCLSGFAGSFV